MSLPITLPPLSDETLTAVLTTFAAQVNAGTYLPETLPHLLAPLAPATPYTAAALAARVCELAGVSRFYRHADTARYQGEAQLNPLVLTVPAHIPHRVAGLGQLVPIPNPTGLGEEYDDGRANRFHEWRWWVGPGRLAVGASSNDSKHGRLLHISASRPKQLPAWAQMTALRAFFYPDTVDAAMILPRSADYVNVSEFCLHLWQLPVEWGIQ